MKWDWPMYKECQFMTELAKWITKRFDPPALFIKK